jgi:hypothetical protein
VFSAVSKEVDRLFPTGKSAVARFEPDGAALVVVGFDQPVAGVVVGSRWELDDSMAATAVYRAGRAARMDDVDWSAVEAPIAVAARQIGPVDGRRPDHGGGPTLGRRHRHGRGAAPARHR